MIIQDTNIIAPPNSGGLFLPNTNGKKNELEPFQRRGIIGFSTEDNSIYNALKKGYKRILACSPGGSGKTVMIAKISKDYITSTTKDVAIFVHRKELLEHARQEIIDWYGIYSQKIDAETKTIQDGIRIFVCMVETFDRRSVESFLKRFENVGMIMFDEAHLDNFTKIFKYFPSDIIKVGWTATPQSANKRVPLNTHYDCIIIMATNRELVELNKRKPSRGIVSCRGHDYSISNIVRKDLKIKSNGDFDEKQMGEEFSKKQQIQNTIAAYEKHCLKTKTLIFNANIEHSLKMNEALNYYFPGISQHIDSDSKSKFGTKQHRKFIFGSGHGDGWFESNDGVILNNVGIATIGTDVKSIQSGIINKSTSSFPLFWQMVLRFDRACVFPDGSIKEFFTFIDMGDNLIGGGFALSVDWFEEGADWEFIFNNPKKPRLGVGAVKSCPECGALNNASARYCTAKIDDWITGEEIECGYIFPFIGGSSIEDLVQKDIYRVEELIKTKVDVKVNMEFFAGRNPYYIFMETIKQVCNMFKKESKYFKNYLEVEEFEIIVQNAIMKAQEYFKESGVPKYPQYKKTTREKCKEVLKELGYIINLQEANEEENVESEN